MADLSWYANRLRAMSAREVAWRLSQKRLERSERRRFAARRRADAAPLYDEVRCLRPDWSRLPLNPENGTFTTEREIGLLGGYPYGEYRTRWHAGFQTANDWPLEFSHDLIYKQRDDIGDARTNWELNRGFQFALLAKAYCASGDGPFLDELRSLEESWARENPFLWGISWTSAMEIAIRCVNWMYAAAFLEASGDEDALALAGNFSCGAANMAAYVADHYSRFSSSNNHAVVEACALGLAGMVYGCGRWEGIARSVLGTEVVRQTHADGVNKEQSLHYQAFFMEAVGLYLLACKANGIAAPAEWGPLLEKMCAYVQDCRVAPGVWLEFGDDDEGVILNLCGPKPDACEYALQLMGVVLDGGERWSDYGQACETLRWLCGAGDLARAAGKALRDNSGCVTYPLGGVSVMRSSDGRMVAGMDHGPLGFGAIAAHGHADALSIQLYVDGQCVIGDPGTYIYHCDLQMRNELRKTCNHSTVCIDGKDQSEMLGAFMWGKRAEVTLIQSGYQPDGSYVVEANHNGYAPATHTRKVTFDGERKLVIEDRLDGADGKTAAVDFAVPGSVESKLADGFAELRAPQGSTVRVGIASVDIEADEMPYSEKYGVLGKGLYLKGEWDGKDGPAVARVEVED